MGRPLYVSDGYAQCKQRRLRRIQRRAAPALWEAFEGGQLSLRALDQLSAKLPPKQQEKWLAKRHQDAEGQHLAAVAIAEFLSDAGNREGSIDLKEITAAILCAIRSPGVRAG
jgi:hypothetical protein